jgi:hypothetical protein
MASGREFRPEVLEHLNALARRRPAPTGHRLAQEACTLLAWQGPDGRPALVSARVALRKLQQRGLLWRPAAPRLKLHLLSGQDDTLHLVWNDLIIAQHPCGDAPLVGAQLRYLIGSDHGWLGAVGFGPAAFALGARDQWIGWSTAARLGHLREVVGLARLLIRQEVHCANLASKVLSLVLAQLAEDWQARYGVRPQLVETFVDRSRFAGRCFRAATWLRVGASTGRGRRGPKTAVRSLKDIWLYPLTGRARPQLQTEVPAPLTPPSLEQSLAPADGCAAELAGLDLGDARRDQRAVQILAARWQPPQASFHGSFSAWTPAKGAYCLIRHPSSDISLASLLHPHTQAAQARMAAEPLVLLPQATTGLNYTGLGPLGEAKGQGLWLHSLLASRPDGVPLGVLAAKAWAGQPARPAQVAVRWAEVTITAPAVGCKKSWPALTLRAIWVSEPRPAAGAEPIDWMLLTDLPSRTAESAWEKVQWHCRRWGIEEWHRALKNGGGVEQREFKTAEHLQRALAFDLIVAWRVPACVKLGRVLPQLAASVLYAPDELAVLQAVFKKKTTPQRRNPLPWARPIAWSPA